MEREESTDLISSSSAAEQMSPISVCVVVEAGRGCKDILITKAVYVTALD